MPELKDLPRPSCDGGCGKDASKMLVEGKKYLGSYCATCGKAELKKSNG